MLLRYAISSPRTPTTPVFFVLVFLRNLVFVLFFVVALACGSVYALSLQTPITVIRWSRDAIRNAIEKHRVTPPQFEVVLKLETLGYFQQM